MSDAPAQKFLRSTLIAGGATLALFAGVAAAPALLARQDAHAQEIVVAPPTGAPMSFADLIERVSPAVVSIQVRQRPGTEGEGPSVEGLPPGFEEFFRGRPNGPQGQAPTVLGSGFFISENGTIVTNHHVVDGAEEITITTSDGEEHRAELVGSDEPTDLAVIRITDGGRFPYVTFDDARHVRVGDWVVAVGNPFGLAGTATAGIVSAIGRRDAGSSAYVDYMQIDAPINRGNSGGPTFDLAGNVIGVNSAIFSPTGGSVGIGFAIPADTAQNVVTQLLRGGRVTRGWIGVTIQPLDNDIARSLGLNNSRGALVTSIVPDGPAARAGIQQGDVILSFDGHDIADNRDLTQRVGATTIGGSSRVEVLRNGQRRTLNLRLAERPSEQVLAAQNQRQTPQQESTNPPGVAQSSLGLSVRPISPEDRTRYELTANEGGLVVTAVTDGSDLQSKGVGPGDVILQAGGRAVRTAEDLTNATDAARRAGRPLLLQVLTRNGNRGYVATETDPG